MEEEEASEDRAQPSPPSPAGLPINWGLITGPVQPVVSAACFPPQLPPPQTSAVHTLQTKLRSIPQRRMRARDRERPEAEASPSSPSQGPLRQWAGGACPASASPSSWHSAVIKTSSTSDEEEEEVEVEVKLDIHSPPAGVKGRGAFQLGGNAEVETNEGPTGGPQDDTCQENPPSSASFSSKVPPPLPVLSTPPVTASATSSTPSSTSARHWAPPKGFWRVARPETLLLNGVGPGSFTSSLPLRDYTQKSSPPPDTSSRSAVAATLDEGNVPSDLQGLDGAENIPDACEQEEGDSKEPCRSASGQDDGALSAEDRLKVKQRAYAKLRERQQKCREEREQGGGEPSSTEGAAQRLEWKGFQEASDSSDSSIPAQDLEPYLRSLLVIRDELPLSPRHEQAKLLLERARLKARSNHVKGERPSRRAHSDQRSTIRKQQVEPLHPPPVQKAIQTEDSPTQSTAGSFLVPNQTDTSPVDQGRRYGCSPTRVRFEDESEKEAESRYLDRVRQRGRPGNPKSKSKESNTDSSSSSSERGRSHRSVSMPPPQKPEDGGVSEVTTVVKEIIVLVKKCEACGSVARELQPVSSPSDQSTGPQNPGNAEDPRGKAVPHWVPPNKPETGTRPKAPLTVTFAGAYVLGENKESGTGWKSSGFGKLRRRSRKGENRLESGHGPYGPSWAQRRNSNPRNRASVSRAVSFAPGSPITLEPQLLEASGGARDSTAPPLPIKSALKSSSRNRSAASQATVQFQVTASQGGEGESQHSVLLDSAEARRESPTGLIPATSNPIPCIRPSTLRYSPARLTTDVPTAELWDGTPDATGLDGELCASPECRPALRGLALSRAEDLRAELLRAEHLKAEALWEESSDGSRKLDGRPKLFLRRFFSSIGLNSVGRLVKGARSSSMEQLSIPAATRASSASPSPTRRPQPAIRIQRTPSLQTLHTVLPLAQLRKASSVQSLERRTERSTILGEVQIPYGLAPSPGSPQLELQKALSVEDALASRLVRPVGRVTQVFADGSLLLELIRPPNGPFGFVISRGKGRPDTGVYVEKVADSSSEGPYTGLLGIGDEILQVNGETVAGLSLDQVTRLMTRESTASLRVMPARRLQR